MSETSGKTGSEDAALPKFVVTVVGTEDVAHTYDSALTAASAARALRAARIGEVVISDEDGRGYAFDDFRRLFIDNTASESAAKGDM